MVDTKLGAAAYVFTPPRLAPPVGRVSVGGVPSRHQTARAYGARLWSPVGVSGVVALGERLARHIAHWATMYNLTTEEVERLLLLRSDLQDSEPEYSDHELRGILAVVLAGRKRAVQRGTSQRRYLLTSGSGPWSPRVKGGRSEVEEFCDTYGLHEHKGAALRLAREEFPDASVTTRVEGDRYPDTRYLVVDVAAQLDVDEALRRRERLLHKWMEVVPPTATERITLTLDLS